MADGGCDATLINTIKTSLAKRFIMGFPSNRLMFRTYCIYVFLNS